MECTSNSIVSSRGRKIKINQSQDFVYYYYVPSKRSKSSNTHVEVKKQNDCTKNKGKCSYVDNVLLIEI